jgi:hypothetical protein
MPTLTLDIQVQKYRGFQLEHLCLPIGRFRGCASLGVENAKG